ncbi:DUF2382 domain-containing protein [Streptomyces sp. NPDC018610]|uniref:DUF2382 domain-containing protein n=1 Tax=Streptomyces sp. NPDC018610 TaxID=3365049 RepID=UPI0037AC3343
MITREQIATVLDHPVHDGDGNKIGDAKHVYLDDVTGLPEFVTVKTGLFGTHETFVPTREASLVQDHIQVPYRKDKVKGAPHIDVDAGGHLSETEEHRLYDYYGLDWSEGTGHGGRTGTGTGGTAGTTGARTTGTAATTGRTGAGGAAAGAATGASAGAAGISADAAARARAAGRTDERAGGRIDERAGERAGGRIDERAGGRIDERAGERAGGRTGEWAGEGTGDRSRTGMGRDDAMTRSEERMHVSVESREVGRARLRKYVVTEEVEQTVPLRHEEVRVEREPITDANRDAALSGPEIGEAEHEVILHEERPVVETEAVPVERVRLTTEEHVSQEKVRGRVRKERIKGEAIGFDETDETGRGRDVRDDRGDTGRGRRL